MLPKPNSTNSVNTKTLELIYLLMTGKPVNFAQCILGVMSKVSSVQPSAPLPYATLLTLVFTHFGVCLTNEIKETKPVTIITPASLKHIYFFKTKSDEWKFVDDMTQEELVSVSKKFGQHVKSRLTSPQITSPSSLLDRILTLDEKVYESQEVVNKLEYTMVQHTDVLYGIAYNQAIIDNCLNRIWTLLTTHISKVHQKLGDLITVENLTFDSAHSKLFLSLLLNKHKALLLLPNSFKEKALTFWFRFLSHWPLVSVL